MPTTVISADSHVTEPPDTHLPRIDPEFRDRAPYMIQDERGDVFHIPGMKVPVPMGLVAAAGTRAEDLRTFGVRFEDLHRGGWDPVARLGDQDRDGVSAEVIYPTVSMAICNHRDLDYKRACMRAYNLWIAEFCLLNGERLMWANDFPHSDSTWPWSQEMLAEHTVHLSDEQRDRILHDNCAELYGITA
jgi:hypothetical protein